MKKNVLLLLICILVLLVTACTDAPKPQELPGETDIQQPQEVQNQEPLPEPELPPEPVFVNPLTGLESQTDLTSKRPVSVMINNLHLALPQIGIGKADIVYEILEEGGITRLLAIYNDYESLPEIGSVRSARDYYIDIADAHDAIFVHAGASSYAFAELAIRKTDDIDGLFVPEFYRSAERRKTMATEHTLMISGEGLSKAISNKGYRTESDSPCPLVFGDNTFEPDTAQAANYIKIPFSLGYTKDPYAVSFFNYDSDIGEYLKGHFNKEHIDGADSSQLSFKNVITLSCPHNRIEGDTSGCIQVHFTGTGTGTYSVNGTMRDIVWKRESRRSSYTLYESDGETPLVLFPGKSYIAVVPTGTTITTN